MSVLLGRWRCDHVPSSTGAGVPVCEWYATEPEALAREAVLLKTTPRVVAWYWPGDYHETPAEEARRHVQEQLGALVPWLKETA